MKLSNRRRDFAVKKKWLSFAACLFAVCLMAVASARSLQDVQEDIDAQKDQLTQLDAHSIELYVGVGNTGNSFGAHLHFEAHDGGSRQTPLGSGCLSV